MQNNKKIVICIGAGLSQVPYLEKLKKLRLLTLAVDINPKSQGFELSDFKLILSTHDYLNTPKKIKEFCDEMNIFPSFLIAPCTGPPFLTF